MNITKTSLIIPCLIAVLLVSCHSKKENSPSDVKNDERNTQVHLNGEQIKAIGLEIGRVSTRNMRTSLKVTGRLTLPPQNKAQVSVFVGGIVKEILVNEGAFVTRGQALAVIENNEFLQLQQDYLENKAKLQFMSLELERQRELQKDNINARKTLQQTESDYLIAQAKEKGMRARLKMYATDANSLSADEVKSTFKLVAPISGNIHTISVNIGRYAEPNKELFDIVDNRFLHIDLTIYEQEIHKIKEGQKLTFSDANESTHVHAATIFSINKAFENNQQSVIAHAKIEDETEALLPGMFVEARVIIDNATVMALPAEAIVSNGNEHYIFIEQGTNTYKQIQVRIGANDMGFTEIIPLETLSSNVRVALKGAYYLLSELTKGEGEHHE